MAIEPNSPEFNLLFLLVLIIIAITGMICVYLGKRVLDKSKEQGFLSFDFLFGIFISMSTLFVSRIIYMYFDFYLTQFDTTKYYLYPNIWYYKIGGLIYLSGFAILLFIIDKELLEFKLKGILAYIIIAVVLIELIYPVNSQKDFEFISALEIIAFFVGLLVPFIFIYIGAKTPSLQATSFIFATGIILFYIGVAIVAEFILAPLRESYGSAIQITIWILSLILQIIGLILMTYASTKYK
ncbi:MAG: hypothetical protein ACFFHV_16795 [Promethearchaeota archaeon]